MKTPDHGPAPAERPAEQPPKKTRNPKKVYQKPEIKTLDPQAAIEKLKPLALAGDKAAQRLIEAVTEKHGLRSDGQHSFVVRN
jgi:hypothetical protein